MTSDATEDTPVQPPKKLRTWERIKKLKKDDPDYPKCPWYIMQQYIEHHHPHLAAPIKIDLMWRRKWSVNRWGLLTLGQAYKCSPQETLIHKKHFIIALNWELWHAAEFTSAQMEHIIDHELQHCFVETDEDGHVIKDEQTGLPKTGIRAHEIEEFHCIVQRHGAPTEGLREFAVACLNEKRQHPLFKRRKAPKTPDRATLQAKAGQQIVDEWMAEQEIALDKKSYTTLKARITERLASHALPVQFNIVHGDGN